MAVEALMIFGDFPGGMCEYAGEIYEIGLFRDEAAVVERYGCQI